MVAFDAAVGLGYRYLETDVHASRDDVLFAHHDDALDRTTDGTGLIAELPAADLRRVRVGGAEAIPTIDEMFEAWPDVCFNIDAKAGRTVQLLAEAINRHRAWHRVCVASFEPLVMHDIRKTMDPRVATAHSRWGVGTLLFMPFAPVRSLFLRGGQTAQVPITKDRLTILKPGFVRRAHASGRQVHAWTINDADQMNWLLDLGVDAIMTDQIETLREVYRARQLWRD